MKEKIKSQEDRKLIKEVFACDPVDWARYPDGKLSFISLTGQKFTYTEEQFENIREAVRQERAATKKISSKKTASKSKKAQPPDNFNISVDAAKQNKKAFGGRGG